MTPFEISFALAICFISFLIGYLVAEGRTSARIRTETSNEILEGMLTALRAEDKEHLFAEITMCMMRFQQRLKNPGPREV